MGIKRILAAVVSLLLLVPLFVTFAQAEDGIISVGKKYTVEYATPIENAYPNKAYKKEKQLTDGEKAKQATYNDKAFVELYRGTAVSVTIDLESVMAVSSVVIGELQNKGAGIICSRYLEVYVSENGTDFGFAGRVDNSLLATDTAAKRVELKAVLDKPYKARYVRAVFSSDIFTYVDEISVYGSEDISSAASAEPVTVEDKGISGDIDGIKSICLMYESGNYSAEMLKPYVAYVDASGKVTDEMFDSLLFLGMPKSSANDGTTRMVDMQNYVQSILSPDRHIGALNTVIGELKSELGWEDDYKYPIFISVPYPQIYAGAFGEIDGKTVGSNSLESRSAIVKWYIDYLESEYSARGFDNLELKGLYWFEEGINYHLSAYEEKLIAYFNEYAHEKGYKTMWIPYYSSAGIDVAKELGFDSVTMQTGYAFDGSDEVGQAKAEVCKDAADTIKKFGLNGMEFELDVNKTEYAKRFAKYVSAAYGAGIMENGMITMYQVGDNLYRCATGSASREVYDLTHSYISGEYFECAPVIKEESATITLEVDSFANARLTVTDDDTPKNALKIAKINKPDVEGLYFGAEGNGYYEVQTFGCAPGTYKASFSVTDGTSVSNTVDITIVVTAKAGSESVSTDESQSDSDSKSNTLVIVLICVGVLVLAAAVFAVLKIRSSKKDKN